jgi:transcriptional regulator with XRE-family HTH domain
MASELGHIIRDLRIGHGWSQARLASEVNRVAHGFAVTADSISRYERGTRKPRPEALAALASALQVPCATLEAVNRRTLITDIAGLAIAPAITNELIRHGFSSALRGGPSEDQWYVSVDEYGAAYMVEGAATIQRRLARDLITLQSQLERPRRWTVAAKLATLFGKTYPGSDGTSAADWYKLAATAADRSGDIDTRVWVRGRAAIALGYEGAALPLAERFAAEAIALSDKPSLGRLNAVMGRAHVFALRGDRNSAYRLLEQGRRLFERVASDPAQASDYSVPEWRMSVFTSLLAARLGNVHLYEEASTDALAVLPETLPRFKTHLQLHEALVIARNGDKAGGMKAAKNAMDALPAEKHSLTLRLLRDEVAA